MEHIYDVIIVGFLPINDLFKDIMTTNQSGYIITDDCMRTNIEGVFAAGDIRGNLSDRWSLQLLTVQ